MYADPSKLRTRIVKFMASDDEIDLIKALVKYTGEQQQPLVRDLVMKMAELVLHGDVDFTPARTGMDGPQVVFKRA